MKKLNKLTQIDGKIKNKEIKAKNKCPHSSYTKVEEDGEKYYECNECGHTWS